MERLQKESEEQLIELAKAKEDADRRLLRCETLFMTIIVIASLVLIALGSFLNIEEWLRLTLIILAATIVVVGALFSLKIEQKAGYYVCPHCGYRYVPKYKDVLLAPHINRTRYMKCPKCGKKGWNEKSISKSIEE